MKTIIFTLLVLLGLLETTYSSSDTCPNSPGRDDLYFIRKDYQTMISHTNNPHAKWYFHTTKHTDTRHGNEVYKGPRRELLKELFANWASWCDDNNVKYMIGHGTLLGWTWNQRILLWDDDMDIIVDWPTFAYLVQYNNTLIHGRYILDVNPSYVYRGYGGYNTIDAEFLDLRTGVYIDITILTPTQHDIKTTHSRMVSETDNCIENCIEDKSIHRYAYDIIYPLRRAYLEGVETWIPNKVFEKLDQEYTSNARTNPEFTAYEWVPPEGWIWIPDAPKEIQRPVRPPRPFATDKYVRYVFDEELNDFYVKEISEVKKGDMEDVFLHEKKVGFWLRNRVAIVKAVSATYDFICALLPLKTYNGILLRARS